MRINKYISETGFCSRRETNRLIAAGRITINGSVCEAGAEVEPLDIVLIDGKPIPINHSEPVYLALNKPIGIVCTAAEQVEGNIIRYVNYPSRIFAIGRLDKASEGLILLTNDGSIVNQMMRSEHGHEKEYVVTVDKPVTDEFTQTMSRGVEILNVITKPCKVDRISEYEFRIILTQGLNLQIRRMCKALGYRVLKLERVRIMNITLDHLERGQWRHLEKEELELLLAKLQ
ncbi:pseudouridine synthase [Paenibacillus jamilae]|uniref:Pseudouridine synthase n=2 Tax=Paenibacillus TaxID=44249 RepID=E3EHW1_PAEPS|nr:MULTISPECIES: pseudouridine synthase [Paenibacillus]ADO56453.1 pseudouridine synthase [Paenibacillus polymyxa SC2]AJE49657.1 pseudouridine synthase [Paenibacillus polymyxa]AUO08907.1 23S rRNA pseudouridine synthase F [Paenibacillus sp. lzh-N1]KAF6561220.1 pseudouridine synthase [Paenibacillus sp. EKM202P]KAF6566144.1 pseudouridine synthase [Paenibacillus sp. EKM207P]